MRTTFLLLLLCISTEGSSYIAVDPDEDPIKVILETSKKDGIYDPGELPEIYSVIENLSEEDIKGHIRWTITTDEGELLKQFDVPLNLRAGKGIHSLCPLYEIKNPGFYNYTCNITLSEGRVIKHSMYIGYDPENIKPNLTKQDDFNDFWERAVSELEGIDPQYKITSQSHDSGLDIDLYFVEMQSLNNVKVTGWLEVPKKKGLYPALLRVPGYTSNMKPVLQYDDMVIFSFNPRSHGDSGEGPFPGQELWVRGLDSEETYYYRGAYMDCLRALDFLAEREEVDNDRIAVWGGSQGGGFSFMIAAMDNRVDYCVADIPWLCDWVKYFETTHWEEIDEWMYLKPERDWNSMLRTLSYFDTKNMASQISSKVLMGIGLQDPVCPPATSFATYNYIKSEKEYIVYPQAEHGLGEKHWSHVYQWLRANFGIKK